MPHGVPPVARAAPGVAVECGGGWRAGPERLGRAGGGGAVGRGVGVGDGSGAAATPAGGAVAAGVASGS